MTEPRPEARLAKRLCHATDLVLGAKIDESEATYAALENGVFGYLRVGVPEGLEAGAEVTLVLKARIVG